MGSGRWDSSDWAKYASSKSYSTKTTSGATGIYSRGSMHGDLNPHGVAMRESHDSTDNPRSNAVIIALTSRDQWG